MKKKTPKIQGKGGGGGSNVGIADVFKLFFILSGKFIFNNSLVPRRHMSRAAYIGKFLEN
jgi:hypothetical protein